VGKFGTGQAIRRTEDQRFITGDGRYTDDISLPDQAYLYVLRSPYAHGTITSLDVNEARKAAGVIAVYTAQDLTAAGVGDIVGAAELIDRGATGIAATAACARVRTLRRRTGCWNCR